MWDYCCIHHEGSENPLARVTRGQVLCLETNSRREPIILVVDATEMCEGAIALDLTLYPIQGQSYLPTAVEMKIIDDREQLVMQTQT